LPLLFSALRFLFDKAKSPSRTHELRNTTETERERERGGRAEKMNSSTETLSQDARNVSGYRHQSHYVLNGVFREQTLAQERYCRYALEVRRRTPFEYRSADENKTQKQTRRTRSRLRSSSCSAVSNSEFAEVDDLQDEQVRHACFGDPLLASAPASPNFHARLASCSNLANNNTFKNSQTQREQREIHVLFFLREVCLSKMKSFASSLEITHNDRHTKKLLSVFLYIIIISLLTCIYLKSSFSCTHTNSDQTLSLSLSESVVNTESTESHSECVCVCRPPAVS